MRHLLTSTERQTLSRTLRFFRVSGRVCTSARSDLMLAPVPRLKFELWSTQFSPLRLHSSFRLAPANRRASGAFLSLVEAIIFPSSPLLASPNHPATRFPPRFLTAGAENSSLHSGREIRSSRSDGRLYICCSHSPCSGANQLPSLWRIKKERSSAEKRDPRQLHRFRHAVQQSCADLLF